MVTGCWEVGRRLTSGACRLLGRVDLSWFASCFKLDFGLAVVMATSVKAATGQALSTALHILAFGSAAKAHDS